MTRYTSLIRAAAAVACLATVGSTWAADLDCPRVSGAGVTPNRVVYALGETQALMSFKTCWPGKMKSIGTLSGLSGADSAVIAIDFRVQDGLLYALANGGGIYTVNTHTAVLTKASQLTVALEGHRFAMDFNPAANAMRIVSDSGQNLRHPFSVPEPRTTFLDTALSYTVGTVASGIVGIGYTNNDVDLNTGSTLFDVDASLNQVSVQAPANNGTLSVTGKLGVDPDAPVGFDVHSRLSGTAARTNLGFASFNVGGHPGFYRIDLLTGQATFLGDMNWAAVDIAVSLD